MVDGYCLTFYKESNKDWTGDWVATAERKPSFSITSDRSESRIPSIEPLAPFLAHVLTRLAATVWFDADVDVGSVTNFAAIGPASDEELAEVEPARKQELVFGVITKAAQAIKNAAKEAAAKAKAAADALKNAGKNGVVKNVNDDPKPVGIVPAYINSRAAMNFREMFDSNMNKEQKESWKSPQLASKDNAEWFQMKANGVLNVSPPQAGALCGANGCPSYSLVADVCAILMSESLALALLRLGFVAA